MAKEDAIVERVTGHLAFLRVERRSSEKLRNSGSLTGAPSPASKKKAEYPEWESGNRYKIMQTTYQSP